MKLPQLFLASALVASVGARAQFAIAPMAGLNSSFAYTAIDNRLYKSNRVGLKAGLIGELELSDNLYLQLGAMYSSYGFTNLNVKLNVDALEIPLGIVYKTGKPGQNRFFVGAGPYLGYQLKAMLRVTNAYLVDIVSDETTNMKRVYPGIDINAGYQIAEGVFTRVAFQPGLAQLIKPDQYFTGYYSAQGSISIGYMIGNRKCKPETPNP